MRALIVTAGLLAFAGVAAAAVPQATTIEHTPAPVEALAQNGGLLAWLAGDGTRCNTVHLTDGVNTYVLPRPTTGTMTCHWDLSRGAEQLAIAANASAALWTLHERGSDFVMTAEVGGRETKVDRLLHRNGTGWWLGGTTGGGTTLAYSSVDVEYIDPLGCASGGSCKKKVAGGEINLVTAGEKTPLPDSRPALGLALENDRIAYIEATAVSGGRPLSTASTVVRVADVSNGSVISQANPVGVPLAVGLAPHVLAVLSRGLRNMRLTWYDPATGQRLGGIAVSALTAPELAVDDQVIVYRFGRALRALVLATRHVRALGKTAPAYLGLSLDQGRLVWAENRLLSGRIRALSMP